LVSRTFLFNLVVLLFFVLRLLLTRRRFNNDSRTFSFTIYITRDSQAGQKYKTLSSKL
jgi:hypothetical protein